MGVPMDRGLTQFRDSVLFQPVVHGSGGGLQAGGGLNDAVAAFPAMVEKRHLPRLVFQRFKGGIHEGHYLRPVRGKKVLCSHR